MHYIASKLQPISSPVALGSIMFFGAIVLGTQSSLLLGALFAGFGMLCLFKANEEALPF